MADYDEEYPDPRENKKEKFSTILARARAKRRDGEKLSPKEIWALNNAAPTHHGITPKVRARLQEVAKLQVFEGLAIPECAKRVGVSLNLLYQHLRKYNDEYSKALAEVTEETKITGSRTKTVTAALMLQQARAAALKVPKVWSEALDAEHRLTIEGADGPEEITEPNWRARLEAAKQLRDTYGLGRESAFLDQRAATPLDAATVELVKDTLGLLRGYATTKPLETTAEILASETTPALPATMPAEREKTAPESTQ